jgi:hypothetical protein
VEGWIFILVARETPKAALACGAQKKITLTVTAQSGLFKPGQVDS